MTVYIMCGLPRSGKSTWIKSKSDSITAVCPDRVRKVIFGHQYHPPVEGMVWSFVTGMVRLLLEQGKDVCLDATSITKSERGQWIRVAKEFDAKTVVVFINTPFQTCLDRNEVSPDDEKLPDEAMERMLNRFENPDKKEEGFDDIWYPEGRNE